ncbi:MAG: membrane dipeptidase [Bacteroidota bacterium]
MFPVIDFHCDLLSYLVNVPNAHALNKEAIGCALPHLKAGNVTLQVLAVFTPTKTGSVKNAYSQFEMFEYLHDKHHEWIYPIGSNLSIIDADKTATMLAIENASGICEEDESISNVFVRLDELVERFGKILYITLTHHTENRFGGGNYASTGLKNDGKELLRYLHNKGIAVDLSHTSDRLAFDILNTIDRLNLNISVIASHSNMRPVWEHSRNLPDELIEELKNRKGLVGVNFVRSFVNNNNSNAIFDHIRYGIDKGLSMVFGADFFSTEMLNDPKRMPYFFKNLSNASQYDKVLEEMKHIGFSEEDCYSLSYQNAVIWLKERGFVFQ